MHSVAVRHTFETGHRLPHLAADKCKNLHGHSWHVEIEVSTPRLDGDGCVVEFGALKKQVRAWIDSRLDHGLMLGYADPLADVLPDYGKCFLFGAISPDVDTDDLPWPTVENVAVLLARVTTHILDEMEVPDETFCSRVTVNETSVNTATWTLDPR